MSSSSSTTSLASSLCSIGAATTASASFSSSSSVSCLSSIFASLAIVAAPTDIDSWQKNIHGLIAKRHKPQTEKGKFQVKNVKENEEGEDGEANDGAAEDDDQHGCEDEAKTAAASHSHFDEKVANDYDEEEEQEEDEEEEEEEEEDEDVDDVEDESGAESDNSGDDDDAGESELEYLVEKIICVSAVQHHMDPKQELCKYCKTSQRSVSEWSCSECAFLQGCCSVCGKVVRLQSLEHPNDGVSACLALLADEQLLEDVCEADSKEEKEAIRQQIRLMLESYFTK